jgi:MFS family permease
VLGGSLGTLAFPAFRAMLATTVPREHLESAVAINGLLLQSARFIGPAIAGVLLATAGPTWVFAVNAASFLGVIVAVALLLALVRFTLHAGPGTLGAPTSVIGLGSLRWRSRPCAPTGWSARRRFARGAR